MSLSIATSRSDLLAEARAEYNRAAATKAMVTGQKAASLPPDSVLIATDPTLSSAVQAADATPVSTGVAAMAGTPTGGGSSAPAGQVLSILG